jgi:hypothetical protein
MPNTLGSLTKESAMFEQHRRRPRRMRTLLADLLAYAEIAAVPDESVEIGDLNLVLEKVR